jgi:site-specific DNA-methyltransferase (adenine-specific)
MKKINDNSVDIIICDPPYNIGKDFGNDSDKQKMDDYLIWCDEWIKECIRILKPHGTLYILKTLLELDSYTIKNLVL